jgi:protein TonB
LKNLRRHTEQHLSASEIDAYLNNSLSHAEAHDVEVHLSHCTLCSEAAEGLELLQPKAGLADDMAAMKSRLAFATNKVSYSSSSGKNVFKIAAAFALLVGIAALMYFLLQTSAEIPTQLAENKTQEVQASTPTEETETEVETENKISPNEEVKVLTSQPNQGSALAEAKKEQPKMADEIKESANNNMAEATSKSPVVGVDVQTEVASNTIPASTPISAIQKATNRGVAPPDYAPSQPIPEKGMEQYKLYLKKSMIYPEEAKKNKIRGVVLLSFVVNESGHPSEIRVENGLGFGCNEEAIRLVEKGPKWLPSIWNGKVTAERTTLMVNFDF